MSQIDIGTTAGGGSGTVTNVSVATANGVSGVVTNPTTTPDITLTLGDITPNSVAAVGTVTGSNLSGTHSGASSGTNTGDQTSIVGITGTIAQFNTACTDADFATGGGTVTGASSGTNTGDQNLFQTIAVSGQSDVVADGPTDTLTLVAGSNVTITTNAGTDTITIAASGSGGASATTVEVDFGSTAITRGRFTITDAGISATSKLMVWQAPGPYTNKGTRADEAEMTPIHIISSVPASGSAVVNWESAEGYTRRLTPLASGGTGATAGQFQKDPQNFINGFLSRIGKVRGNVKFNYVVFS